MIKPWATSPQNIKFMTVSITTLKKGNTSILPTAISLTHIKSSIKNRVKQSVKTPTNSFLTKNNYNSNLEPKSFCTMHFSHIVNEPSDSTFECEKHSLRRIISLSATKHT